MTTNLTRLKLHSFHIISFLIIGLFLGSVGVGLLIQHNPLIKSFDDNLYQAIHDGYHAKWIDFLITPFNYNFLPTQLSPGRMPSYYYFMVLLTLIYLSIYKRSLVIWAFFGFIFGTILTFATSALDWHFVFRERPFYFLPNSVDEVGKAAWGQLSSFPSGHVRETTLYTTLIASWIPKLKWPAIIFVLFIAFSRIYIGAHYPTDVLSAIIIGYISARVTLIVARELQLLINQRKGKTHGQKPKPSQKDLHQK